MICPFCARFPLFLFGLGLLSTRCSDDTLPPVDVYWVWLQIGLVSQEPLLFSGSVLDNIMYGKADANMTEVSG